MQSKKSSVFRGIFIFFTVSLMTASCNVSTTEHFSNPSPEIQVTSTQPWENLINLQGTGVSDGNFPSSILPARFTVSSMGGTHSIMLASRFGNFEAIDLIYTPSLSEVNYGITRVELVDEEVFVRIETEGMWFLEIEQLSEDNFLAIPGKVSGTGNFFFLLTLSPPRYLFLDWAEEEDFISINALNGETLDNLVATTKPYSGWMPISADVKAIQVRTNGNWYIEIVDKPNLVD